MTRLTDGLREVLGGRTAAALTDAFGMETVADLLNHVPRRYARRGELTDLGALVEGELVTVLAEVRSATARRMQGRKGNLLEVLVTDGHGDLSLTFFNQAWREKDLRPGRVGLFAGKVGNYRGRRQLTHPDYVLFADQTEGDEVAAEFLRDFVGVYPAAAKVRSWTVARCVRMVLEHLEIPSAEDVVPESVRLAAGLVPLATAYRQVHQPDSMADIEAGLRRLRFNEAWQVQVVLALRRQALAGEPAVARRAADGYLTTALLARLPFALTSGQQAIVAQLNADLAAEHPMNRLLQGEVGSGKTIVALLAMLTVVGAGGQAVLLAPTEVLAEQHYRSICELLGPLGRAGQLDGDPNGTEIVLLTGSMGAAARRKALLAIASGSAGIVVGTHALLGDPVEFADLGLVVVDEQHRFGVEQRAALTRKSPSGFRPHVLVMTATPIPRTVAMTVFGDLEVSTLRELPGGRAPITTHVAPADRPRYVDRMWSRIVEEVSAGRQAYIVCPRIDSDSTPDQPPDGAEAAAPHTVLALAADLEQGALSDVRVGVLHGRLSSEEKDEVMSRFRNPEDPGGIDVLVATTVIEVGVDVPNATVMVIMDAERFGVSQLHQLRGRVGRGGHPGLCLLHTATDADNPSRERLAAVASTVDGFELSELDLQQRREGDVLGAAQSGRRSSLGLLSVLRDEDLIGLARQQADVLLSQDPQLTTQPALAAAVAQWLADERLEYADKS